MNDFPFATVGFDLDGTLIDTSEDLRGACNHALALGGLPPMSLEQIRSAIGRGGKAMLWQGIAITGAGRLDDALFATYYAAFLDHYAANIAVHSRPYPGALDALDALADMGVRLGVVTNKQERLAVMLFDALGLTTRFDALLGGDSLGPGRSKPAPDLLHEMIARTGGGAAAFVGDSHFDMDAARAANIPSVAVSFGFSTDVESLGAGAIIDGFDALIPTLRKLGCLPSS